MNIQRQAIRSAGTSTDLPGLSDGFPKMLWWLICLFSRACLVDRLCAVADHQRLFTKLHQRQLNKSREPLWADKLCNSSSRFAVLEFHAHHDKICAF